MIYQALNEEDVLSPLSELVLLIIFFSSMAAVVLSKSFIFIEQRYALYYGKPFFINVIVFKKDLTKQQLRILENNFVFYNSLSEKQQTIFRHRTARFINDKVFLGRKGLEVSDEMKVLISATAVMLTLGFRKYHLDIIEKIIIYPKAYLSKINAVYHKGEVNPQLKTIVLSWEDFKKGYKIGDDNLNLGIHEFGHAIHLGAFSSGDISSVIFNQGFQDLTNYLREHQTVRERLIASKYFRAYAYTNHYEFFAVLLENFIENPKEFKYHFPNLYGYMKQMLNFNFTGY